MTLMENDHSRDAAAPALSAKSSFTAFAALVRAGSGLEGHRHAAARASGRRRGRGTVERELHRRILHRARPVQDHGLDGGRGGVARRSGQRRNLAHVRSAGRRHRTRAVGLERAVVGRVVHQDAHPRGGDVVELQVGLASALPVDHAERIDARPGCGHRPGVFAARVRHEGRGIALELAHPRGEEVPGHIPTNTW